jgi:hypothetical protein
VLTLGIFARDCVEDGTGSTTNLPSVAIIRLLYELFILGVCMFEIMLSWGRGLRLDNDVVVDRLYCELVYLKNCVEDIFNFCFTFLLLPRLFPDCLAFLDLS